MRRAAPKVDGALSVTERERSAVSDVYVIGTGCTPFGKHADRSFSDLAQWAYLDALSDAGLAASDAALIEQAGRDSRAGLLYAHGAVGPVP